MRLFIITQRVDSRDPLTGFFVGWLKQFALHAEQITVIGQYVGTYELPPHVHVFSLGKEKGYSKVRQVFRFWHIIWRERRQYDVVFVHQVALWVLLGCPLWKSRKLPMYLWYEGYTMTKYLRLALHCLRKVFGATPKGMGLKTLHPKNVLIGQGADTDLFHPPADGKRERGLICSVGRITPVKNVDALLRAFAALPPTSRLLLVGGTVTPRDEEYRKSMEELMVTLGVRDRVEIRFLRHEEIPPVLERAELFLHACGGGLNKAVLEAMAAGCLVASSNDAVGPFLPSQCRATLETLGACASALLSLPEEERRSLGSALRDIVVRSHSVSYLVRRICEEMSS